MKPHPLIRPYVNHHNGEAWVVLPCLDDDGNVILRRFPLSLHDAVTLAADAAKAAQHLAYFKPRIAADARPTDAIGSQTPSLVSA